MKIIGITLTILVAVSFTSQGQTYKIVDTDQSVCYDSLDEISAPAAGTIFYGQDAQFNGYQPSYTDNGDGTITDNVTGLMWTKTSDLDGDGDIDYDDKLSYDEALAAADTFSLAGYEDWRLPSIKEAYSLIMFSGYDVSSYTGTSTEGLIPFINTDYFDFGYGDMNAGERIIDAQFASTNIYVGVTMGGDETMFGVNFADGRIKGYPIGPMPGQTEDKQFYVMYCRGNTSYGINDFQDNNDGTITDNATGLMWSKDDSGEGLNWAEALDYAYNATTVGYSDWRLPNAKELQSIVDYTRSPQTTSSAAIDPMFNVTAITDEGGNINYPFYWTGTTHASVGDFGGTYGAYVTFGEALGWMEMPPGSGEYSLLDVHGAGAQRSDPKVGDPNDYPYGHGPQGDVIRIYNYVRLVRNVEGVGIEGDNGIKRTLDIYPNPSSSQVNISGFNDGNSTIRVYNLIGTLVKTVLINNIESYTLDITDMDSGVYLIQIENSMHTFTGRFVKE
ncbi:MAG: hypothetical protein C0599_17475 [Salinivirgaceae bacterium]|nr:MAG: hypothetical protein C0599_17475 [Salinivirgaceae bacterium]